VSSTSHTTKPWAARGYVRTMPGSWWTRKRHYFWYIVREFSALPLALWLIWLLIEIKRGADGPAAYRPHAGLGFVIFSVICFLFSLYHSITFLSLAGVIIHLKVLDRPVPPRVIVDVMFFLWIVATILIGWVLIGFAR
jgi:fumarate reductase subunit C